MKITVNLETEGLVENDNIFTPSPTRTAAITVKELNGKTIYLTPKEADSYRRLQQRLWQQSQREGRCIVFSERYGAKVCRGNCSQCEKARDRYPLSIEALTEKIGHEPNTGEFADRQEAEDPSKIYERKETMMFIKKAMDEIGANVFDICWRRIVLEESIQIIADDYGINRETLRKMIIKWTKILQDKLAWLKN